MRARLPDAVAKCHARCSFRCWRQAPNPHDENHHTLISHACWHAKTQQIGRNSCQSLEPARLARSLWDSRASSSHNLSVRRHVCVHGVISRRRCPYFLVVLHILLGSAVIRKRIPQSLRKQMETGRSMPPTTPHCCPVLRAFRAVPRHEFRSNHCCTRGIIQLTNT